MISMGYSVCILLGFATMMLIALDGVQRLKVQRHCMSSETVTGGLFDNLAEVPRIYQMRSVSLSNTTPAMIYL
jgi:hypothetical protein